MLTAGIAVLISGGGTNLQALIDAQESGIIRSGEIRMVISSKEGAYGLERAKKAGIPTAVVSRKEAGSQEAFEKGITDVLEGSDIDMIVLAGFMQILSADFTTKYAGRIINVHPSLIPSFCGEGCYGLRVHRMALNYGVRVTGATVHYVNEIPDGGSIIMQKAVEIQPADTPRTLQKRVMEQAEWQILPLATEKVAEKLMKEKKAMEMRHRIFEPAELLADNSYPGRGVLLGQSPSGRAVCAYFIMGRSENSRNRVFALKDGELFTEPFDPAKVEDPSLIIYAALRKAGGSIIVTNGDQTDTIVEYIEKGSSFEEALRTREFEPDKPNYTPRISGILAFAEGTFSYRISILKSEDPEGEACARYTYEYEPEAGLGHLIHTYECDGNPLPSFEGEPRRIAVSDDVDEFAEKLWRSLDNDNRISLYVRYTDPVSGEYEDRLINKYE